MLICMRTPRLRSGCNTRLRSGCNTRLRSGYKPRLRSGYSRLKLLVERSRDEKSSLYNHHPSAPLGVQCPASLGVQEPRRGDIPLAPSGRHHNVIVISNSSPSFISCSFLISALMGRRYASCFVSNQMEVCHCV
jgi:hypothetical protein